MMETRHRDTEQHNVRHETQVCQKTPEAQKSASTIADEQKRLHENNFKNQESLSVSEQRVRLGAASKRQTQNKPENKEKAKTATTAQEHSQNAARRLGQKQARAAAAVASGW
jgi:hypothetical protein